ncbi:hypothetical protein TIFTF001_012433 [Ficus carica]|uniref:Uncharacterized protein n=1 Tax=Ficus carica TaxID=3494 RepID=A0AA88D3P5_FICCA|nr:hypothetical protein TIFTF001_012433 [Ficus carica]
MPCRIIFVSLSSLSSRTIPSLSTPFPVFPQDRDVALSVLSSKRDRGIHLRRLDLDNAPSAAYATFNGEAPRLFLSPLSFSLTSPVVSGEWTLWSPVARMMSGGVRS